MYDMKIVCEFYNFTVLLKGFNKIYLTLYKMIKSQVFCGFNNVRRSTFSAFYLCPTFIDMNGVNLSEVLGILK